MDIFTLAAAKAYVDQRLDEVIEEKEKEEEILSLLGSDSE